MFVIIIVKRINSSIVRTDTYCDISILTSHSGLGLTDSTSRSGIRNRQKTITSRSGIGNRQKTITSRSGIGNRQKTITSRSGIRSRQKTITSRSGVRNRQKRMTSQDLALETDRKE